MSLINHEFEADILEYFKLIWNRKWLIISLLILAISSTVFFVKMIDPVYSTSATILIQENDGMQNMFSGDMFSMGKDMVSTYNRMLKTRKLLEEVIIKADVRDLKGDFMTSDHLRSLIKVTSITGTDLIEISIEHTDPVKAVTIVNTLVTVFQEKSTEMNKSAIAGARIFIEQQLTQVKRELEMAENNLLAYKQNNNIVLPSEEAKQAVQKLVEIESIRSMLVVEQKAINASIQGIQQQLEGQEETVVSSTVISNNPLIKQYKAQITELEGQLIEAKVKYATKHPEVKSLEERINTLMVELEKEVQQEISSQTKALNPVFQSLYQSQVDLETKWLANQAKLDSYNYLVNEYEQELQYLPDKELQLARLERVNNVSSQIYIMLMTRLEEFKISEAMQTSNVFIVDLAYLPKVPIRPNKKLLILMAGFLAIVIGIAVSFILEFMDTTIKSPEEIERMFSLPVLGSIPDVKRIKKIQSRH